MTIIESKRILVLGKKNGLKVSTRPDDQVPNERIVIINGFYYDDASIVATDIINNEF